MSQPNPTGSSTEGQSPPSFTEWLATARTEEGAFPDWSYLEDTAQSLASGADLTILKRRQILASWLLAAYAHWTACYHDAAHVAIISAGQREADELARKIGFLAAQDGDGGHKTGLRLRRYRSGSQIVVLPSTAHAGIGYTLKLAIFDEFAAHPEAKANLAAVRPAVSGGQLVICSTTHPGIGASGAFYEAWEAASSGGAVNRSGAGDGASVASGSHALFLGRDVRPDQRDEWLTRERAKYSDEEFSSYYPATPEEAFTAPTGLVLRIVPHRTFKPAPVPWSECKWRLVACDPGGNDPSAVVMLGVAPDERMHVYGAKRWRGATAFRDMSDWAMEFNQARGVASQACHRWFGPPEQAAGIEDLVRLNWKAQKAPNARGPGIGLVRQVLDEGRLTISPELADLRHELLTYWWDPDSNQPFATKTSGDHHADLVDAMRYAVTGMFAAYPAGRVAEREAKAPAKLQRLLEEARERRNGTGGEGFKVAW